MTLIQRDFSAQNLSSLKNHYWRQSSDVWGSISIPPSTHLCQSNERHLLVNYSKMPTPSSLFTRVGFTPILLRTFPQLFHTTCVPVLDISTYITRCWLNCVNHDYTNKTFSNHPCVVVLLATTTTTTSIWRRVARVGITSPYSTRIEYGVVTEQRGYLRMGAATLRACKDVFDREKGQSQARG